nr:MAG TPA: hypothetical protein [Caudoviricetes sp.]
MVTLKCGNPSTRVYLLNMVLIKALTMHHSMPRKTHKILCLQRVY